MAVTKHYKIPKIKYKTRVLSGSVDIVNNPKNNYVFLAIIDEASVYFNDVSQYESDLNNLREKYNPLYTSIGVLDVYDAHYGDYPYGPGSIIPYSKEFPNEIEHRTTGRFNWSEEDFINFINELFPFSEYNGYVTLYCDDSGSMSIQDFQPTLDQVKATLESQGHIVEIIPSSDERWLNWAYQYVPEGTGKINHSIFGVEYALNHLNKRHIQHYSIEDLNQMQQTSILLKDKSVFRPLDISNIDNGLYIKEIPIEDGNPENYDVFAYNLEENEFQFKYLPIDDINNSLYLKNIPVNSMDPSSVTDEGSRIALRLLNDEYKPEPIIKDDSAEVFYAYSSQKIEELISGLENKVEEIKEKKERFQRDVNTLITLLPHLFRGTNDFTSEDVNGVNVDDMMDQIEESYRIPKILFPLNGSTMSEICRFQVTSFNSTSKDDNYVETEWEVLDGNGNVLFTKTTSEPTLSLSNCIKGEKPEEPEMPEGPEQPAMNKVVISIVDEAQKYTVEGAYFYAETGEELAEYEEDLQNMRNYYDSSQMALGVIDVENTTNSIIPDHGVGCIVPPNRPIPAEVNHREIDQWVWSGSDYADFARNIIPNSSSNAEITFVGDDSGSIHFENYENELNEAKSILEGEGHTVDIVNIGNNERWICWYNQILQGDICGDNQSGPLGANHVSIAAIDESCNTGGEDSYFEEPQQLALHVIRTQPENLELPAYQNDLDDLRSVYDSQQHGIGVIDVATTSHEEKLNAFGAGSIIPPSRNFPSEFEHRKLDTPTSWSASDYVDFAKSLIPDSSRTATIHFSEEEPASKGSNDVRPAIEEAKEILENEGHNVSITQHSDERWIKWISDDLNNI